MGMSDPQQRPIHRAHQFVFINQFEPRVEIVFVLEVYGRFKRVAVQVTHFARTAGVISSPDKCAGPVAALPRSVVLDRSRQPADVGGGLSRFGLTQKAVRKLHRPVIDWLKAQTRRARIPTVRVKVVAIFVRLTAIENAALEPETAITEPGGEYTKTYMRRVRQVVRERGGRILRGRSAMHESRRSQRRLARISEVSKP